MVTGGTLGDRWRSAAEQWPDRIAIHDARDESAWTFTDLWERMQRIGSALLHHGLRPGDRVAILSAGFGRGYLEAEQGVMAAGLVRVPIDPSTPPDELTAQLAHSQPKAIVFEPAFEEAVAVARNGSEALFPLDTPRFERLLGESGIGSLPAARPGDLASLNFTGGTTGAPKAVALTHRNLVSVVDAVNQARPLVGSDLLLNVRPMWPISGILVTIHLLGGTGIVLGGRFDAATFADEVARWRATHTSLVPTMLVRLLAGSDGPIDGLGTLRSIDIGAAGVPPGRLAEAVSRIGPWFGAVYGLTEAPWTCYRPPPDLLDGDGSWATSVGRPLGRHRIRIEGDEGALPPGEVGEVVIAGNHVMRGYWRDEAATAAAMTADGFRSGDLGRIDQAGRLHVVGRIKELIRTGGRSVQPQEVEDVIRGVSGVDDVAVVGLLDEEWGEQVVAAVVSHDPGLTADDIMRGCRSLAPHKKPRAVRFVDSLPRSHYGKVLRHELRLLLAERDEPTP